MADILVSPLNLFRQGKRLLLSYPAMLYQNFGTLDTTEVARGSVDLVPVSAYNYSAASVSSGDVNKLDTSALTSESLNGYRVTIKAQALGIGRPLSIPAEMQVVPIHIMSYGADVASSNTFEIGKPLVGANSQILSGQDSFLIDRNNAPTTFTFPNILRMLYSRGNSSIADWIVSTFIGMTIYVTIEAEINDYN